MNNNELPAETAAEKTTEAEVKTSRHTIGKPHVGSRFFVKMSTFRLQKFHLMSNTKFKIEVPDWTKIDIENAKFILEEGRSYVKYLSDGSDKITNRAFAILTVLIPITSALIAFVVHEKYKPMFGDKVVPMFLVVIITGLIVIMFGLGKIVFPRLFMPIGRAPKEIITDRFLAIDFDTKLAQLSIILNEIENCQSKVDYNEVQNGERTKRLEYLLLGFGMLLIVSLIFIIINLS